MGDVSFAADKARVLGQVDLSRKGSVDAAIAPLLAYVNAQECFYSTSSCAGRLVVFAEGREQRKKGCHWLLVSHDPLLPAQLESVLGSTLPEEGYVYFKFEPFVLHVMCASLQDARLMLQAAVSSGYRNSGMSCGRKERWMVAVRSTHSLETPLACSGTAITTAEYRKHVLDIGNAKLRENLDRVQRFLEHLKTAVESRTEALSAAAECSKRKPPAHCSSSLSHKDPVHVVCEPEEDDFSTLFNS